MVEPRSLRGRILRGSLLTMANKLETIFRKSLNQIKHRTYFLKLQVHPDARTCMPADFLILGQHRRYLVECKQVDLRKNEKNTRFPFSRLTQAPALEDFEARHPTQNEAYILLGFWRRFTKESSFFLLPLSVYNSLTETTARKSVNLDTLEELGEYKLRVLPGSVLCLESAFL